MKRDTVRWMLIFLVALIVTAGSRAEEIPDQPEAPQALDLYMKDTPLDTGIEPNPDTGPMWVTEDIWVRTSPDPNYQPQPFNAASPPWIPAAHENPEYRDPRLSTPNYVYIRIRNRGDAPSTGTERLRLYAAKASTGLGWPAQWVDYVVNNGTKDVLYGIEVTKPRKNAGTATVAERNAYRDAILDIGTLPGFVLPDGYTYWRKQDDVHEFGPSNRHGTSAFLPWHREFINRYEAMLQEADPTVKLLYWDWTTDPANTTGGFNIFSSSFMGASGRGTGGTPIGLPFSGLGAPAVSRNLSIDTTPNVDSDATLLSNLTNPTYQLFGPDIENVPNHNSMHGYIGGGGNMSGIDTAAEDPFFFMLHTNVDRLWAQWQRNPANLSRLAPATAYDGNSGSVNITSNMGPWNGTSGTNFNGVTRSPWTSYLKNKTPRDPSVVFPPIYDTAPLVIPILQPGQAVVIEIPWYPPNPADFASFGGDQGHFCLLARIETSTTAPFGMSTAETADVYANTKNNNNIVWKNITVVDNFPGALQFTSILLRNIFDASVLTGLRFADTGQIGASFFDFGSIIVDLKPELYERWIAGNSVGQGVEPLGKNRIQIFSPNAFIGNIELKPEEVFSIDVHFELNKDYEPVEGLVPKWDLIQVGTPEDPNGIVGGQRFEVDISRLAPIPEGAEWHYLDDGSDPGQDWFAPGFDDSRWKSGNAELGFGDDPMTIIDGGPPDKRHITTYFRRAFDIDNPGIFQSLLLRLKRDDGAVVYLNGVEVHRVNMPGGVVGPDTLATREVAGLEEEMFFPTMVVDGPGMLQPGLNVVAVEIHQDSPDSPDLSFDLALLGNLAVPQFPPDVAFVKPADGTLFQHGGAIPIEVEALDSDGDIKAVSLYVNGALLDTDDQAPYTFEWSGAPLGIHLLRAEAEDNDGELATADLTLSVVTNTPPLVELILPVDGTMVDVGEPVSLLAEASDPGGGIERVEFYAREANLFMAPNQLVGSVDEAPYAFDLNTLPPGGYMIMAVAVDDDGATSESMPAHIHIHAEHQVYLPAVAR